jgi:2-haloalkanoic acid dehalogenase type II
MRSILEFTTLTFDCYGTLIDWERGMLSELRPWANAHGVQATDGEMLEAFAEIESRCERETPDRPYPGILEDVLHGLAKRWSVSLAEGEARRFGGSIGRWPPFEDSPGALSYLKRHYKLAILSNVDRASFARSEEKLGIQFDRVVTAQDVGSYKPDPRNFRYLLDDLRRALGVEPHQVLHTAQSIFHDVVPAKAIGLRTMWVNRRKGKEGWGATLPPSAAGEAGRPDFEVGSLAELAALHKRQLAGEGR